MTYDQSYVVFILIMIGLFTMAFAIREWLRNRKKKKPLGRLITIYRSSVYERFGQLNFKTFFP